MKYKKLKQKNKKTFLESFLHIFFGFLVPYILINGVIFFVFIQSPKINVVGQDSKDYEENKIKFHIDSLLPLTDVKTYYEGEEVAYSKLGSTYVIDASNNGSYEVKAYSLNKSTVSKSIDVETKDNVPPIIDSSSAVITGNTLIISIHDNQSSINYDNLYATLENGSNISPNFIDKSSGTVQFQITNGKKIVIHVEDMSGNKAETSFTIS